VECVVGARRGRSCRRLDLDAQRAAEMEIYVDGGSAGDASVESEVWRRSVSS